MAGIEATEASTACGNATLLDSDQTQRVLEASMRR
jgi:hypothetical protein